MSACRDHLDLTLQRPCFGLCVSKASSAFLPFPSLEASQRAWDTREPWSKSCALNDTLPILSPGPFCPDVCSTLNLEHRFYFPTWGHLCYKRRDFPPKKLSTVHEGKYREVLTFTCIEGGPDKPLKMHKEEKKTPFILVKTVCHLNYSIKKPDCLGLSLGR